MLTCVNKIYREKVSNMIERVYVEVEDNPVIP